MNEQIQRNSFLNNLIHINRYSGLQLLKNESVSDHVWSMHALALSIVPDINKQIDDCNKENGTNVKPLDLKDIIYRITIHDIDESLYCDIPRPFKYHNRQIYDAIEATSQELMEENLGVELLNDINNAKDVSTREGFLVKLLDTVQAGLKMRQEITLGNSYLKSEIRNVNGTLTSLYDNLKGGHHYSFDAIFTEYMKVFISDMNLEFHNSAL